MSPTLRETSAEFPLSSDVPMSLPQEMHADTQMPSHGAKDAFRLDVESVSPALVYGPRELNSTTVSINKCAF
jgi:hypothetical protein